MKLELKDNKLVQSWSDIQPQKTRANNSGFACQSLCGKNLTRPHLTCLFCRMRRAYYGKMPSKIEVTPYVLLIRSDRRFVHIKAVLLKKLLTICEWLAN